MKTRLKIEERKCGKTTYEAEIPAILVTASEIAEGGLYFSFIENTMGGEIFSYFSVSQEGDVATIQGEIPQKEECFLPSRLFELRNKILQRNKFLQT